MDLTKMGAFISEKRKQKNLTQQELADMLHLSNRTISKWECGKGIPDSAIMIELCEILEISVNELLAGEELSNDDYKNKADENIIALITEPKTIYKQELVSILHSIFIELILFLFVVFCVYLNTMSGANVVDYIDIPALLIVLGASGITLVATGLHTDYFKALQMSMRSCDSLSKEEVSRAFYAVLITVLASFFSGAVLSIASVVNTLVTTVPDNEGAMYAALAVGLLGVLYALVICLLMVPVMGKLLRIKCHNCKVE